MMRSFMKEFVGNGYKSCGRTVIMSEELEIFLGDLGLTRIGKFVLLHLLLSCLKSTLSYENIVLIKK